ncbi:MAG TPA: alpha/beta hydrolase, partial [Oceanicaulis sp.]|nr:alpha/beta hydrolase [Oceanicaulis sp.]
MPPAQKINVGEVNLSVHLAGPEDGVPVLLMHGWPELALSWAQQIEDLANAGYRVIAADNRGFGA